MKTKTWTRDGFEIAHGCTPEQLYVAIPHQRAPHLVSAAEHPPNEDDGDGDFAGDHDLHSRVLVTDAHTWQGHQRHAVHAVAEGALAEAEQWS